MKPGRRSACALALAASLAAWSPVIAAPPPAPAPTQAAAAASAPAESSRKVLVLLKLPPGHYRGGADYSDSYGDEMGRAARRRIGSQLAQAEGLSLVTDWAIPALGLDCLVLAIPDGRDEADVAARIARDKRVAWAEPLNVFHAKARAGRPDPLLLAQPATQAWRLVELHEIATGANVSVAVIDSGVDASHPDLVGQVRVNRDFITSRRPPAERHGTGVAAIIAARANDGVGIAGVAPGARLLALRACAEGAGQPSSTASCDSLSIAKALDFAIAHHAQVINLSFSGPQDRLLGQLLDVALSRGITVVGAYDDALARGGFPASHPGVIAAADGWTGTRASGAFLAPGRDVPTAQPNGRWALVNGSSYSAAHVSGLAALVRQGSHPMEPKLLAVRAGRAIDACATLLRAYGDCRCGCARAVARTAAR
jgi:subtilisin family serine protease